MKSWLIGKNTAVTQKLLEELSKHHPAMLVLYNKELENTLPQMVKEPPFIFVNLMDVHQPASLAQLTKTFFSQVPLIGIHCYDTPSMVSQVLEQGYDKYISLFNLSEDLLL